MGEPHLLDMDEPAPDIPFEDMRIPVSPPDISVTASWEDGKVQRTFTMDDIDKLSHEEFRLFIMGCLCGNGDDPRFVEAFKPKAD